MSLVQRNRPAAPVSAGLLCCALLASCALPEGEVPRLGPYHVGEVYESTNTLVLVNPATRDATLMTLEASGQAADMEAFAGRPALVKEDLPPGTRFEIASIYRKNQSSWNNGISYWHRSTVRMLTGAHAGETARADGIFLLQEGNGGRPLPVPLRLIGRGGAAARQQ